MVYFTTLHYSLCFKDASFYENNNCNKMHNTDSVSNLSLFNSMSQS